MTNEEYKEFLKSLERQFPSFAEWLKRPSHDWKAMSQTYYDGLKEEKVTIDEAKEVLKGWTTGTIEGAPVGFENQRFLANLLNAVREKRSKEMHKQTQDSWRNGILGECKDIPIRSKIPNPSPLTGKMADLFRQMISERIPAA